MASDYILRIILCKVSYFQKLCLVILFKVNKSLEIFFYFTILLFNLATNLKLKVKEKKLFDI